MRAQRRTLARLALCLSSACCSLCHGLTPRGRGAGTGGEAPGVIAMHAAPSSGTRGEGHDACRHLDKEQEASISTPIAFKRHIHVAKNPETGEFEGLEEWMKAHSEKSSP